MRSRRLVRPFAAIVLAGLLQVPALAPAGAVAPSGLDLAGREASVRPQDDFYRYANGGWLSRTRLGAHQDSVTLAGELAERVESRLQELARAAASAPESTPEGRYGALYAAFMDQSRVEALGAEPLRAALAAIRDARDRSDLAALMGRSSFDFAGSLYALGIDVDLGNPDRYAVYLGQAGLGLPDRDWYTGGAYRLTRAAYRSYVERLLTLTGWTDPGNAASAVLAVETRLAAASWSRGAQRDLRALYNPMSPADLARLAPGFDWTRFLDAALLGDERRLIVAEYSAVPRLAAIFADTPLPTLKAWQAAQLADAAAPYLAESFVQAHAQFHRGALLGDHGVPERTRRAVAAVAGGDCAEEPRSCFGTLRFAIGQSYALRDFGPEARTGAVRMTTLLRAALRARIERSDWLRPATRDEALRKLDRLQIKVGYPDSPRDLAPVAMRRDDLMGDVRAAARADWEYLVAHRGRPVDRADWQVPPQTTEPHWGQLGDLVLPAAFLQPPFFDPLADPAVNFGMSGARIGHELIHLIDDDGRAVDATGSRRDWWSQADAAEYHRRAAALAARYRTQEALPGVAVNTELTGTEDVADLGGLLVALDAYHRSLQGRAAPVIDGLSGDQRFFLAYAQSLRAIVADSVAREQLRVDVHSPPHVRVLGPLPHVDAWYAAFDVKDGDRMYLPPDARARIF